MLDFLYDNLALVAIAVISGGMLLWSLVTKGRKGSEVDNAAATELINHNGARVVDIRTSRDFKQGHIAGSESFPATEIHHRLSELDKKKPILLVSAEGDAGMVVKLLKGMGYASVMVLKGGIKAWREAELPVVK
ncbi:MAG: rhodanese-like domain-containing protein [Sutterellaceae bacterium]|nr:rhodanese-like domain-containing protein [Sutterellaceae bacterium]MDY2868895.1 rhodanese-like domain-containing protein [Mesosutterella sp.]